MVSLEADTPLLVWRIGQGSRGTAALAAALASGGANTDRCVEDAMKLVRQSRTSPVLKVREGTSAFTKPCSTPTLSC